MNINAQACIFSLYFEGNMTYRGILSSIVADDLKPSRMPFGPLSDVVNLSIDDQPLIIPAAVALHLLPGVNTFSFPAVRLSRHRLLASTSHPYRCFWSECT